MRSLLLLAQADGMTDNEPAACRPLFLNRVHRDCAAAVRKEVSRRLRTILYDTGSRNFSRHRYTEPSILNADRQPSALSVYHRRLWLHRQIFRERLSATHQFD